MTKKEILHTLERADAVRALRSPSASWFEPQPCEYGYPEICGEKGIFLIPASKYYPALAYSCEKHLFKMATTGVAPRICYNYVGEV